MRAVPPEYILIAQDQPLVERYVRQPDEKWLLTTFKDLAATFSFATVPAEIPMTAIYRQVSLPEIAGN